MKKFWRKIIKNEYHKWLCRGVLANQCREWSRSLRFQLGVFMDWIGSVLRKNHQIQFCRFCSLTIQSILIWFFSSTIEVCIGLDRLINTSNSSRLHTSQCLHQKVLFESMERWGGEWKWRVSKYKKNCLLCLGEG